tara:strand:+ start:472 stop:615 length:144 start_codon:yes stop_codon:yes gene_type:complete
MNRIEELEAEIASLKKERDKIEKISHQRWARIQELNGEINELKEAYE